MCYRYSGLGVPGPVNASMMPQRPPVSNMSSVPLIPSQAPKPGASMPINPNQERLGNRTGEYLIFRRF